MEPSSPDSTAILHTWSAQSIHLAHQRREFEQCLAPRKDAERWYCRNRIPRASNFCVAWDCDGRHWWAKLSSWSCERCNPPSNSLSPMFCPPWFLLMQFLVNPFVKARWSPSYGFQTQIWDRTWSCCLWLVQFQVCFCLLFICTWIRIEFRFWS